MKHTKGPWRIFETDPATGEIIIISDGRPYVCSVIPGSYDDVTEANARLIAAAPELLAALRDVIGWVPDRGWHTDEPVAAIARARAAIAKATGADHG